MGLFSSDVKLSILSPDNTANILPFIPLLFVGVGVTVLGVTGVGVIGVGVIGVGVIGVGVIGVGVGVI